ncbi:MAG: 1-deoxy-D-xylulose-5-phosphate reductoisomerase, partial [Saprospiraceae bacterium]
MKRNVVILGSTGSIGVSTLDVIGRHPDRFACFGLSANTDWQGMLVQCLAFQPSYAVMADLTASNQLRSALKGHNSATQVLQSVDALSQLASDAQVNVVVSGIVGAAGLLSTLAAVEAGKTVLIANKEPLVMLGDEIVSLAKTTGATLLPLDSE